MRETAPRALPPAIILIEPQLGQNIGKAARAMLNCGLQDLRLVAPRDGWPSEPAQANASGADVVIDNARVFDTAQKAIADLHRVFVTTARARDAVKPVFTPRGLAPEIHALAARGEKTGVMFGPERTGVRNTHIALCDAVVTVPLNPGFPSLNLAQAVLLIGYEWWCETDETPAAELVLGTSRPAEKADLERMFEHLESSLDAAGYFRSPDKKPTMLRNIRNMFHRAGLTHQEVQTLRGIIKALARDKR